MSDARATAVAVAEPPETEDVARAPVLLFFTRRTSGPARRMASLIAWVKVTRRKRLRVVEVDADDHPELLRRLQVSKVPSLVLVKGRRVVGRLEGRATGHDIEQMISPHLS
jgi:thioredoxin-like negative regulator of GroEL